MRMSRKPGGRMIHGPEQVDLRTMGRITSAGQFGDIIIAYRGAPPYVFATLPA